MVFAHRAPHRRGRDRDGGGDRGRDRRPGRRTTRWWPKARARWAWPPCARAGCASDDGRPAAVVVTGANIDAARARAAAHPALTRRRAAMPGSRARWRPWPCWRAPSSAAPGGGPAGPRSGRALGLGVGAVLWRVLTARGAERDRVRPGALSPTSGGGSSRTATTTTIACPPSCAAASRRTSRSSSPRSASPASRWRPPRAAAAGGRLRGHAHRGLGRRPLGPPGGGAPLPAGLRPRLLLRRERPLRPGPPLGHGHPLRAHARGELRRSRRRVPRRPPRVRAPARRGADPLRRRAARARRRARAASGWTSSTRRWTACGAASRCSIPTPERARPSSWPWRWRRSSSSPLDLRRRHREVYAILRDYFAPGPGGLGRGARARLIARAPPSRPRAHPAPSRAVAPPGARRDREGPGDGRRAATVREPGLAGGAGGAIALGPEPQGAVAGALVAPAPLRGRRRAGGGQAGGPARGADRSRRPRRGHGPGPRAGVRRPPAAAAALRRRRAPPRPRHLGRARLRALPARAGRAARSLPRPPHRAPVRAPSSTALPPADEGQVDAPIYDVYEAGRRRLARPGEPAHDARTRWRVVERFRAGALLEVELETGRQHQIRVHLAHLGLPIVGDRVYGRPARPARQPPPRQMLHARHLAFVHPLTGARVEAESPLARGFPGGAGRAAARRPRRGGRSRPRPEERRPPVAARNQGDGVGEARRALPRRRPRTRAAWKGCGPGSSAGPTTRARPPARPGGSPRSAGGRPRPGRWSRSAR